jgi:hypothetical protein
MRVSKTIFALIACLGLGARESGAQILGGQPTAPRLVQLNVVALDSHGQPVGDLTAADFHITDAGKKQEVSLFRHSESKLQQPIPLRPGEFSNRTADNVPHATLILFDLFNEGFGARGAAENYLVHGLQSLESDSYLIFISSRRMPSFIRCIRCPARKASRSGRWTLDQREQEFDRPGTGQSLSTAAH